MTCIYVSFVHLSSDLYENFHFKTTPPFFGLIEMISRYTMLIHAMFPLIIHFKTLNKT
jgi:hypothetical protein